KDNEGIGGVYTLEAISTNETIVSIPSSICITEHIARQALPAFSSLSSRLVLCLFLLIEKQKGQNSFYWPYINILPKTIKTSLCFDENDLKYIQNTNLEFTTRERKAYLHKEFEKILENLPSDIDKDQISWEEFLWCYNVISSRSFPSRLIDSSSEKEEALFPLLDAFNHKPNTKITWSSDEDGKFISFIAGQNIGSQDQVFNNYGPKASICVFYFISLYIVKLTR
ncbi:uncharacterized protein BX663DRAFT_439791, partial [Cokeromyces recurvatus]|uniref:uncharacterized protein n=1 Tax=Cokeromyces recurvatus TaxID=90255 RepID=UPI002220F829